MAFSNNEMRLTVVKMQIKSNVWIQASVFIKESIWNALIQAAKTLKKKNGGDKHQSVISAALAAKKCCQIPTNSYHTYGSSHQPRWALAENTERVCRKKRQFHLGTGGASLEIPSMVRVWIAKPHGTELAQNFNQTFWSGSKSPPCLACPAARRAPAQGQLLSSGLFGHAEEKNQSAAAGEIPEGEIQTPN